MTDLFDPWVFKAGAFVLAMLTMLAVLVYANLHLDKRKRDAVIGRDQHDAVRQARIARLQQRARDRNSKPDMWGQNPPAA